MKILQRRLVRVAAAAVAIIALFSSGSARASVFYDYVGNNFTVFGGTSFTTSDSITGFVEFATAPLAGENNKTDVVDFSFTAGPLSLDSSSGMSSAFTFDFNTDPQFIDTWSVAVGPSASPFFPRFQICNLGAVSLVIGGFSYCTPTQIVDRAFVSADESGEGFSSPGTWTLSVSPVPLPAALPLFGSALAMLGMVGWRRRRQAGA